MSSQHQYNATKPSSNRNT